MMVTFFLHALLLFSVNSRLIRTPVVLPHFDYEADTDTMLSPQRESNPTATTTELDGSAHSTVLLLEAAFDKTKADVLESSPPSIDKSTSDPLGLGTGNTEEDVAADGVVSNNQFNQFTSTTPQCDTNTDEDLKDEVSDEDLKDEVSDEDLRDKAEFMNQTFPSLVTEANSPASTTETVGWTRPTISLVEAAFDQTKADVLESDLPSMDFSTFVTSSGVHTTQEGVTLDKVLLIQLDDVRATTSEGDLLVDDQGEEEEALARPHAIIIENEEGNGTSEEIQNNGKEVTITRNDAGFFIFLFCGTTENVTDLNGTSSFNGTCGIAEWFNAAQWDILDLQYALQVVGINGTPLWVIALVYLLAGLMLTCTGIMLMVFLAKFIMHTIKSIKKALVYGNIYNNFEAIF